MKNRAKLVSLTISQIRKNEVNFTRTGMINALIRENCPYASRVFPLLKKLELIEKNTDGTYCFTKAEPVYYGLLVKPLEEIAIRYISKPKQEKLLEESEMIDFLKSKGFKIFKPVTEFKEC